jgi:hypothetical protein
MGEGVVLLNEAITLTDGVRVVAWHAVPHPQGLVWEDVVELAPITYTTYGERNLDWS